MTVHHCGLTLDWLGYATTRIETPEGFVAYFDPGRYGVLTGEWTPWSEDVTHPPSTDYDARDADLVCVTHDHHYDEDGVRRVASPDATVVAYEGIDAGRIDRDVVPVEELPYEVVRVGYGESVDVGPATVEAVPGYNDPEGPRADAQGNVVHHRGFGCGFRVELPGRGGTEAVFYPGDSDAVPEHEPLDVSVFLPPISEELTMGAAEAADLAEILDPELVLPVHYDTFDGLDGDSETLAVEVASRAIPVALDEH